MSDTLQQWQAVQNALREASKNKEIDTATFEEAKTKVSGTIDFITTKRRGWTPDLIHRWAPAHPVLASVAVYAILIFSVNILLLIFRPQWLLALNESLLLPKSLSLPEQLRCLELAPRYVLGVGFVQYHPRVLDAWVYRHIEKVRENLYAHPAFAAHSLYVDVLVHFPTADKQPAPADFHELFHQDRAVLWLEGTSGSGKTALACQIAFWALADRKHERLCKTHRMLPLFLEENLSEMQTDTVPFLLHEIGLRLAHILGMEDTPSKTLVKNLLTQRRILLIADSYSERNEATRKSLQNASSCFLNRMVVTSRSASPQNHEVLAVRTSLPQGQGSTAFVMNYLNRCGQGQLIQSKALSEELDRLTEMVGDRAVTMLIAQLYAQSLIERQENGNLKHLQSVPELVDAYITGICHKANDRRYSVQSLYALVCKIAWVCLQDSLTSMEASVSKIEAALLDANDGVALPAGQSRPQPILTFCVVKLRLLQWHGLNRQNLTFTLAPLAEYLAARYLIVSGCRNSLMAWNDFFVEAQRKQEAGASITGFLQALYDTVEAKGEETNVPDFVLSKLHDMLHPGFPVETRHASVLETPLFDTAVVRVRTDSTTSV